MESWSPEPLLSRRFAAFILHDAFNMRPSRSFTAKVLLELDFPEVEDVRRAESQLEKLLKPKRSSERMQKAYFLSA